MFNLFRKRDKPEEAPQETKPDPDSDPKALEDELRWIFPPKTLVDPADWDNYWREQIAHNVAGMTDMFCRDGALIDVMRANNFESVLCVGPGLSSEPLALAAAGFKVTALDLSPLVIEKLSSVKFPDEAFDQILEGRERRLAGSLRCVAGDLCDRSLCPGPFDVVIERLTLQLYPDDQRDGAMQAVADRLAGRGIFFSQFHDGGWHPPAPRVHRNESWFMAHGWQHWFGAGSLSGRIAWLYTTTG